ncbi:hypothetical protein [Proteiniphilum sp.]|uniref:hypothetical protein n=1 Tax=Proteiniphilum sp. TaxID=1926877 RepID=UPI002B211A3D|nr:hypothetical protein [Proteiniphilum sp.]MEA4919008.1 hypothetical protein [Proteiniphilum sp.]
MKNRILIISLFLVMFLLSGIGCTKEDDINELPPATREGANTFGCKINGEVYKTLVEWKYSMITLREGVRTGYKNGEMYISGDFIHPRIGRVYFTFRYDGGLGRYRDITDVKKNSDSYIDITRFDDEVVSGTFNVVKYAPESVGGDSITTYYTEGRFDIKRNN